MSKLDGYCSSGIGYHGDRDVGSIYFFDTFLKKKDTGWLGKCRYVVLYFVGGVVAVLGGLSSGEKQKIFMV